MDQVRFKADPAEEMVPRVLVAAMFGLMLVTLGIVALARLTDAPLTGTVAVSDTVTSRQIVLTGDRGGAYSVTAPDGTLLAMSDEGPNGFLGVMGRVIDRKRLTTGAEADAPIVVRRRADGIVEISDPATGMIVPLMGYGKDNVAAFARLLD